MFPKSNILIIAGSDSSGGAGIQADIKTVTALGSYAMTAITAVTSQNTTGVKSIVSIGAKEISKQINYTCSDIPPDGIKIGMIHSAQVIEEVIKSLKRIKTKLIVLDPVMISKNGTKLINDSAIKILKNKFINNSYLITPNIPEAEVLTKTKINSTNDMVLAAQQLLDQGAKNVLIKGGHLNSNKIYDILLNKNTLKIFKSKKYYSKNTHGTGCTLSTAITTYLSCGKGLIKSCELGIKYVNEAIKSKLNLGKGNGPINHLNSFDIKKRF